MNVLYSSAHAYPLYATECIIKDCKSIFPCLICVGYASQNSSKSDWASTICARRCTVRQYSCDCWLIAGILRPKVWRLMTCPRSSRGIGSGSDMPIKSITLWQALSLLPFPFLEYGLETCLVKGICLFLRLCYFLRWFLSYVWQAQWMQDTLRTFRDVKKSLSVNKCPLP